MSERTRHQIIIALLIVMLGWVLFALPAHGQSPSATETGELIDGLREWRESREAQRLLLKEQTELQESIVIEGTRILDWLKGFTPALDLTVKTNALIAALTKAVWQIIGLALSLTVLVWLGHVLYAVAYVRVVSFFTK